MTRRFSPQPSARVAAALLGVSLCVPPFLCMSALGSSPQMSSPYDATPAQHGIAQDAEVAAAFAPIFHQALGDSPRLDYLTNFDFDGDWRGDNNWKNAENREFPLRAFVYYSVAETATHYFIHYAVFHPRDYKGGSKRGAILSQILREGAKRGSKYDPTGRLDDAVLAHENDMEGCLIVAAKGASLAGARVEYVETVAHDRFERYVVSGGKRGFDSVAVSGQRAMLYIEPKGHGIYRFEAGERKEDKVLLVYEFAGRADDPERRQSDRLGYDLVPIQSSLLARAQKGVSETYGEEADYGEFGISYLGSRSRAQSQQARIGKLGSAFLGKAGAPNKARPPWGWFDVREPDARRGEWYFDPAKTIKRHFKLGSSFPVAYMRNHAAGL